MQTLVMPSLKLSGEVTVLRWLAAVGRPVKAGQPLVQVQGDDGIAEINAPADGSLSEVLCAEKAVVASGDALARFDASATAAAKKADPAAKSTDAAADKAAKAAEKATSATRPTDAEKATPASRPTEEKAAPASRPTEEKAAPATTPTDGNASKATAVLMPKAGNTMEEGTIVAWRVKVGDAIAVGDIIFEVETDKATVEVEADAAGRLALILAEEGDIVPIMEPVAVLADNDADAAAWAAENGAGAGGASSSAEGKAAPADAAAEKATPATTPTDGNSSKATAVLMPKAGNTMEEGTIVAWRAKVGDAIAVGDIIFEVETDKATVEVEADAAGRLALILAEEGDIVPIMEPVAVLADNDADAAAWAAENGAGAATSNGAVEKAATPATSATPTTPATPAPAATASSVSAPAAVGAGGRVKASPAARKLAAEKNVDLASMAAGSGPGGRILSTDVAAAGDAAPARRVAVEPAAVTLGGRQKRPLSNMRKAIAANLLASKQTIPHFYIETEIVADAALAFYKAEKQKYPCTINDVIVRACALAISEFPAFRSSFNGGELIEHANSNIGVAVGIDDGLIVPVVVGVEQMSLAQCAAETRRVVEAARSGKIENMGKGVFTISNLGMFGVSRFAAIINPPEAAILAVGAALEKVVVTDGAMKAARVMTLTLSCDHRVIDGLVAARFLQRLKEILENPAAAL